jgi:phosphatidate cytidylyltransferase
MAAARWTDLRKRAISAAVLAPLAVGAIWFGDLLWIGLTIVATAGLLHEWVPLCGLRWRSATALAIALPVVLAGLIAVTGHSGAGVIILCLATPVAYAVAGRAKAPRLSAVGVPYIGLACLALLWLRDDDSAGRANVLFLILIVWAADIGAYMAGRLIGGPKLAPAISPSKTWAGAAGGLAGGMLAGLGVMGWMDPAGSAAPAAGLAAVLAISSQAGDLLESYVKRYFGVKDSGTLIPGHGGLLDRLDGVLGAAPVAAVMAMLAGRGVMLWG